MYIQGNEGQCAKKEIFLNLQNDFVCPYPQRSFENFVTFNLSESSFVAKIITNEQFFNQLKVS